MTLVTLENHNNNDMLLTQ